jgi:hypothetical protein
VPKIFPSVPDPQPNLPSLVQAVSMLKRNVEMMVTQFNTPTRQDKSRTNQVFIQRSAPVAQNEGDLWVNTGDSNKLVVWSGTEWVPVTI